MAGFALVCPLPAQDFAPLNAGDFLAEDGYVERTELLEGELAALRERLDMLETGNCNDPGCSPACVSPGWTLNVDYLNWTLRRRDLDFAISTDDSALAVGAGVVHELEFDRDSGVRAGLAYMTKAGWEIAFTYTYFHTSASAAALAPGGGNLWATRSHPDRNEQAATAMAMASFDYDVLDLEIGHPLPMNRFTALKMFGGLRWANIDQDLRCEYDGIDFANGVVTHPVSMDAFGVRLGLEGSWQLPRGFSLFGRGAGSVMYGNFRSRLLETNLSGADLIVDVSNDYEQAVPVLEAAVGASWRNSWLEIAAGYEFTNWFNLGDRSSFVDNEHEGLYAPEATDVLLDGFFIRCAARF